MIPNLLSKKSKWYLIMRRASKMSIKKERERDQGVEATHLRIEEINLQIINGDTSISLIYQKMLQN